jgi:hypothetical protein
MVDIVDLVGGGGGPLAEWIPLLGLEIRFGGSGGAGGLGPDPAGSSGEG